jgi:intracellular multiplication protein IcmP
MKGGGGQQQPPNNSADFLWACAAVIIGLALLWYNKSAWIIAQVLKLKRLEVVFVKSIFIWIGDLGLDYFVLPEEAVFNGIITKIDNVNPYVMGFSDFASLCGQASYYLCWPLAAFAGLATIYLLFFHISSIFNRVFTMKNLREVSQGDWPFTQVVVNTDLAKLPLDKAPWSMSETPMIFAQNHGLLNKITKEGKPAVVVNEKAAHRQFSLQLGSFWNGLESLPPYAQALFTIFAAKVENDTKAANALLEQIAKSATSDKATGLDFSGTRELLVKHVKSRKVGRAVGPHAFILTVMASMLDLARTDGVLSCAEFLWLKAVDRPMWYMLSSVGRQTPFPEVSGVFAHWIVEKRLRRPLKVPVVQEAVKALVEAIDDIKYNPDEHG